MELFESNIDFNKYKVFLAVADCKSFSKATELLHVSQPAISHAIKELEDQLNTKLFIRNNKSVSLTEEGEKLKYYIKNALNTIHLAEISLKEQNDYLCGVIRIGIYSHISLFMLPKVMKEFNKKHPDATFYIYSGSNDEMLSKLRNNELDLVIMQYPIFLSDATFTEEILCELKTCFFANKKYCDLYSNNHEAIKELPIMLPKRGFADITHLEETLKKHNVILKQTITSYTTELSICLAKEGLGIGWGIKKCIENEFESGNLFELEMDFQTPNAIFSVAYDKNYLNKTTEEFIKLFKLRMQEIS